MTTFADMKLEVLKQKAAKGDLQAQGDLAVENYYENVAKNGAMGRILKSDSEILESLKKTANQGHIKSQVTLGTIYHTGLRYDNSLKYTQDFKSAREWYTKAADQGDAEAQTQLGNLYDKGIGVTQNYIKAVEWYTKAVNQNNHNAQYLLGKMYEEGRGVSQSDSKAIELYTQAASDKYASEAQYNLGVMYATGRGVTPNYEKAVELFSKAASQNYRKAQLGLGIMYLEGEGVTQDYKKALELITTAAKGSWHRKGLSEAKYVLAHMYEEGIGVKENIGEALDLYIEAAEEGDQDAKIRLKFFFEEFKKRAEATDDVGAQNNLALMYAGGLGVEKNYVMAKKWYLKAAQNGHAIAQYNVGVNYAKGENGFDKDINEARKWLKKSSENGDNDAKEFLDKLN